MSTDPATAGSSYKLCPRCQHIYPASNRFCARDSTELIADSRILAGKYLLLRQIGEGNMGTVHEAQQPQVGRKVAVKLLRPDPEVMLRFEREVHSAGALNHENVVTIYDSGLTEDGRGYIAMEFLEGESLSNHLEAQGPLPPTAALSLWAQAVRGISAAHSKGIVHRDLKPDNLFIVRRTSDEGPESVLKVLDFGIAEVCSIFIDGESVLLFPPGKVTERCAHRARKLCNIKWQAAAPPYRRARNSTLPCRSTDFG